MDVNKIIANGDAKQALVALTQLKMHCKRGDIISVINFLCPEDSPSKSSDNWKGVIKREEFNVVQTKNRRQS